MSEDRRQRTDDGGQCVRRRRTVCQMTEDGGQRTEDRDQRSDDRRQKTDDR